MSYQVLLYYKYIKVEDPEKLMQEQKSLCESLNLKGRIIVSSEGINGTVEGTLENTQKYIDTMRNSKYFSDIIFKKSESDGNAFPRLSVKIRGELVTAGLPNLDPTKTTGKYLEVDELYKWFIEGKEFYMVDMRNDYEYISGHFENSILSDFKNFRDLPSILPKLAHLRDKTIVTCCTGGVRCEKASGFLVENGFADVYQLKDGIQTYMETYPNKHFKGKLYVFDGRITVGFNTDSPEHTIISVCEKCNVKCDSYVNCQNLRCHKHYICCSDCKDKETNMYFCDEICKAKALLSMKQSSA